MATLHDPIGKQQAVVDALVELKALTRHSIGRYLYRTKDIEEVASEPGISPCVVEKHVALGVTRRSKFIESRDASGELILFIRA